MTSPEPIPPRYREGDPPKPQAKEGGGAGTASGIDKPLWQRLAWFVGLWAAGVGTVVGIAFLLRLWIAA